MCLEIVQVNVRKYMLDESMGSEKEAKDQFSKKSKIYNESTFFIL